MSSYAGDANFETGPGFVTRYSVNVHIYTHVYSDVETFTVR